MTHEGGADDAGLERFVSLLNKKGLVRLVDVFLSRGSRPLTSAELQELTGLSQPTVSRRGRDLHEMGIIVQSDEEAAERRYMLNRDHPSVESLRKAHLRLHATTDEIREASPEYDGESDLYHEGSPFAELFRYPTNVKLLAAVLAFPEDALTAAQIARVADIDRSTVIENIDTLCDIGLVESQEKPFRSGTTYSLNHDHLAAKPFLQALDDLRESAQTDLVQNPAESEAEPVDEPTADELQAEPTSNDDQEPSSRGRLSTEDDELDRQTWLEERRSAKQIRPEWTTLVVDHEDRSIVIGESVPDDILDEMETEKLTNDPRSMVVELSESDRDSESGTEPDTEAQSERAQAYRLQEQASQVQRTDLDNRPDDDDLREFGKRLEQRTTDDYSAGQDDNAETAICAA